MVNGGGGAPFSFLLLLPSLQGGPDGRWEGMGAEICLDSAHKCTEDLFSLLMIGGLSVDKVMQESFGLRSR